MASGPKCSVGGRVDSGLKLKKVQAWGTAGGSQQAIPLGRTPFPWLVALVTMWRLELSAVLKYMLDSNHLSNQETNRLGGEQDTIRA